MTQVGDYNAQAYAIVSGPIKKDKLFFTIGVAPSGTQFTLTQSFYNRVDLDDSGGYENCPYENGTNDCVQGGNYIATEKFAEQKFKTGAINFGYIAGIDWAITPAPQARLDRARAARPSCGPPTGSRLASTPTRSGPTRAPTPSVAPRASLPASSTITSAPRSRTPPWSALNYEGRVLDDKMEIDAGVSYFQSVSEDAWRLDNPNLKNIPSTQEQDSQGRNLYEFLDRAGAVDLVPGVDQACNGADLPGHRLSRRGFGCRAASVSTTATSTVASRVGSTSRTSSRARARTRSSGAATCRTCSGAASTPTPARTTPTSTTTARRGSRGGGEYCYDSANNSYDFDHATRVNNHRFIDRRHRQPGQPHHPRVRHHPPRAERPPGPRRSARPRRPDRRLRRDPLDPQLLGLPPRQVGDPVEPVPQRRRALGDPGHAGHLRRHEDPDLEQRRAPPRRRLRLDRRR